MKKGLLILFISLFVTLVFSNDIFVSSYFTNNITGLNFSPENSIAVLNNKRDIRIFDSETFEMQQHFETDNVNLVADWSADMKYFITGDNKGNVNVFNLDNDIFSFDINYSDESIVDLKIADNMVAFTSLNRDVYLYNIVKRKLIFKYSLEDLPSSMFFDGEDFVVGDNNGNIHMIDYESFEIEKISVSPTPVKDILKFNNEILVFTLDGRISIYNETRLINRIFTGSPINKVIKSPHDDYFMVHFSNNDLVVYNVSTMIKTLELKELNFKIIDISWTNKWNKVFLTDGNDIYDVSITSGIIRKSFDNKGIVPIKVLWRDNRIIYLDDSSNIGFINSSNGRIERIYKLNYKFNDFYLDDSNILYTVDGDGVLKVFDLENNSMITSKSISDSSLTNIDISNDNRFISVGGWDYNVYILDKESLRILKAFENTHKNWIKSIKFNEFSTMLAVSGLDKRISVTNVNVLENLNILNNFNYNIWSIDWSSDSNYIVTGGFEGVIEIWDPVFTSLQKRSNISTSPINIVSWSPDNSVILSGTNEGTIYTWNPNNLSLDFSLKRTDNEITDISWSENSRFFVTADDSNVIRIWDLQEKKILASFMIFGDGKYISYQDSGEYVSNIDENNTKNYFIKKPPLNLFDTLNYKKVDELMLQENNPPIINSPDKFVYNRNNKNIMISVTDNKEIKSVKVNESSYTANSNYLNINYTIDIEKLKNNIITITAIDNSGNTVKKEIEISFDNISLTVISNQAPVRDEQGRLLGVVSRGINVELLGVRDDAYKIKYKDKIGYIQKPLLYTTE
ncbi:MAG: WD40 repeat domain-containing protein [Thermotogota bacterium]